MALAITTTPPLAAEYITPSGEPTRPEVEEVRMMEPLPPAFFRRSSANWMPK